MAKKTKTGSTAHKGSKNKTWRRNENIKQQTTKRTDTKHKHRYHRYGENVINSFTLSQDEPKKHFGLKDLSL